MRDKLKNALILFVLAVIQLKSAIFAAEAPVLYYWDAKPRCGFSNFGDELSRVIVEKITGQAVSTTAEPFIGRKKLLALGSIMHCAEENDVVWGTGINGKMADNAHFRFQNLDIRAVRGPLTRKFLQDRGVTCPE